MGDELFVVTVQVLGLIVARALQIIVSLESCPRPSSDCLQQFLAFVGVGLDDGFEGVRVSFDGVQ